MSLLIRIFTQFQVKMTVDELLLSFGVCYGTYVSCLGLFSVKIEFFDPAGFSVDKQFDLVLRTRCVKVNYKFSK